MCHYYSPTIIEELTYKVKILSDELDNANKTIQQLKEMLKDHNAKEIKK